MVLPERSDFPPLGMARVDPHTEQEISVDALSKIIASAPQSRQVIFRNFPDIVIPHLSTSSNFLALLPLGE